MRLRFVNGPGFRFICMRCGKHFDRADVRYADLDGKAFTDYYCGSCVENGLTGTNKEYDDMLKVKMEGGV